MRKRKNAVVQCKHTIDATERIAVIDSTKKNPRGRKCFKCGSKDHMRSKCTFKKDKSLESLPGRKTYADFAVQCEITSHDNNGVALEDKCEVETIKIVKSKSNTDQPIIELGYANNLLKEQK